MTAASESVELLWALEQSDIEDSAPMLASLVEADVHALLRALGREVREAWAHEAADRRAVTVFADAITAKHLDRLERARWLRDRLVELAEPLLEDGSKHVEIVGVGRVQFTDRKRSAKIADAEAFIAWAREHEHPELIEERTVVIAAKAKPVALAALEAGETLPGVEDVPRARGGVFQPHATEYDS